MYVGTLDDRIDVAMLHAVTAVGGTVVLVGDVLTPAHYASLREEPRVHFHGPVPRADVPAIVAAADVGLVPHRRTALTEAMSPLKLYEYLAAGVPVAATDLGPMRAVPPRVALGADAAGFAAATRTALARGPMDQAERARFLAENSWEMRHRAVLAHAFA